jgi:predicted nucleic acid-binding protein
VILLDASVLVRYLRTRDPQLAKQLNELELGICGITRAEILHGSKDDADRAQLVRLLDSFPPVPMAPTLWDKLGHNLCELRKSGIVIPFTDAAVATVAIEENVEVWAFDRHFPLMANVLPLKLFQDSGQVG